jgi:hypothetical protein
MNALEKELGTVGTVYFLRLFTTGKGNYTAERDKIFEGFTMDEILKDVREIERKKHTGEGDYEGKTVEEMMKEIQEIEKK